MICRSCGAQISDNSVFCTNCGVRVQPVSDTAQESAAAESNAQADTAQESAAAESNAQADTAQESAAAESNAQADTVQESAAAESNAQTDTVQESAAAESNAQADTVQESAAAESNAQADTAQMNGTPNGQAQMNGAPNGQAQMNGVPYGQAQMNGAPNGQVQMNGVPYGQAQMNGQPNGQVQMNGAPYGQAQMNGVPYGQAQMNGAPNGQAQMNGAPNGQVPYGQAQMNGVPNGQAQMNGVPNGQVQMNGVPNGQVPYGQAQMNGAPYGQAVKPPKKPFVMPAAVNAVFGILAVAAAAICVCILFLGKPEEKKSDLTVNALAIPPQRQAVEGTDELNVDLSGVAYQLEIPETDGYRAAQELAEGYIFADSDTRRLEESDLYAHTHAELWHAFFEILAREGIDLSDIDEEEYAYFQRKNWYEPTISLIDILERISEEQMERYANGEDPYDVLLDAEILNETEIYNMKLIEEYLMYGTTFYGGVEDALEDMLEE